MNSSPILIIPGETKSIFFEIFKSIKLTQVKSPLILICNREIYIKKLKDLSLSNI